MKLYGGRPASTEPKYSFDVYITVQYQTLLMLINTDTKSSIFSTYFSSNTYFFNFLKDILKGKLLDFSECDCIYLSCTRPKNVGYP